MDLVDQIEGRRFVGREFLLWLWFETEIFEATLETKEHGPFGLWVGSRIGLSDRKESTVIKGATPGAHREAKEALLRGKMPDTMGFTLSREDGDARFVLKGETLGLVGLVLPTVLGDGADEDATTLAKPTPKKKRRESDRAREEEAEADEAAEAFYERMQLAKTIEDILEALFRDFTALRLSDAWSRGVMPKLEAWVAGEDVDGDGYRAVRAAHAATKKKSK